VTFPKALSHRKPITPAVMDTIEIAIFEAFITSGLPKNARLVIKIDIVKPKLGEFSNLKASHNKNLLIRIF